MSNLTFPDIYYFNDSTDMQTATGQEHIICSWTGLSLILYNWEKYSSPHMYVGAKKKNFP